MKRFFSIVIAATFLFFTGCGYNRLQATEEEVKASFAELDNQYLRRRELIPNLVQAVKGYAKHESGTLEAVIQARNGAMNPNAGTDHIRVDNLSDPSQMKKYQDAQNNINSALSKLMVVVENYPNLKANENFRDLQAQLEGTENRISVARKRYIDKVAEFNTMVRSFPTNLTANFILHMKPVETLTATAEEKTVPEVKF